MNTNFQSHTINVSHNCISKVSDVKYKEMFLVVFDLSFNKVQKLMKHAFTNMPLIKFIVLKYNKIFIIERYAFTNITNSFLIDLSCNNLNTFPQLALVQIGKLQILNIIENPLADINAHMFEDTNTSFSLISTSNYSICCVKPENSLCITQHKTEDTSCSKLLPTDIGVVVTAVCIVLLNVMTIAFGSYYRNKSKKLRIKKGAFLISGAVVIFGELVLGIYLIMLLGGNA